MLDGERSFHPALSINAPSSRFNESYFLPRMFSTFISVLISIVAIKVFTSFSILFQLIFFAIIKNYVCCIWAPRGAVLMITWCQSALSAIDPDSNT